jgi:hypothetical protein
MPSLDPRFVQVPSLQDYFVDKDSGFPLSAGIVTFYEDNDHTVLKPVYQLSATPSNTFIYTPLANPLQLSSVGTFIDENGNDIIPYFFPYDGSPNSTLGIIDLYFITVYSAQGVFQFSRDAWPNLSSASSSLSSLALTDNIISNPQFSVVNFSTTTPSTGVVYNVTGTALVTNIAPDWDVITSGSGTFTVKQIASTNNAIKSNPSFLLDITSSNTLTSLKLRQRLLEDPRILANGFANGSFVVGSQDSSTHFLTMDYVPSNAPIGTSYQLINQVIPATGFNQYSGTKAINGVINNDSPLTPGYVDIIINIPPGAHIQITSIQVIGVANENITTNFIEQTTQRELDHLFHYYSQPLQDKPISSYLVGWDFPLNPAQPNGSTVPAAAVFNKSTWDQTILFQTTISKMGTTRASNGAMIITSSDVTNATQFGLIQYLPAPITEEMFKNRLSVNVEAFTSNTNGLIGTISLWYTPNALVPTLPLSFVTTVNANGYPTAVAAGWTEITRNNNAGNAQFLLNSTLSNYGFNGWDATGTTASATASYFAIFVGFAAMNNAATVNFNSISVVPGDIPTKPAPKTFDDVLKECQFFYEKSYDNAVVPGTAASPSGLITARQNAQPDGGGATTSMYGTLIDLNYNSVKWVPAAASRITFYSPITGTGGNVLATIVNNGTAYTQDIAIAGNYTAIQFGQKSFQYASLNPAALFTQAVAALPNAYAYVDYHYVIDLRIGAF